jgi:hypothetical protein
MNHKLLNFTSKFLLFSIITLAVSCKKDGKEANTREAAENNAFAEAQFNDVTTLVDQASATGSVTFGAAGTSGGNGIEGPLGSPCVSVIVDTTANPRSITIDFGNTNCLCLDGRNRRGIIVATYTGKYRDAGTVINITFQNYYVNDFHISGTKTITNQGLNQANNLVYKVEVDGSVEKPNNGGTFTWISTRYREWKAGASTPLNVLDDVYSITGNASGVNPDGSEYTLTATTALVRKMNCRWFESGIIELTQPNVPKITLDYGGSGCDAMATISVLGVTYPVMLQ